MTDTSAFTRHIEFRRNFLAAKSATERGELCREHLAHLLPKDPNQRKKICWNALNLGNGSVVRIALIETAFDRPGARLLMVRGRTVIHTRRFDSEAGARHAAYMFDWSGVHE